MVMPSPCVVLVVEDEALLRLNAIDIVEDLGCVALEASNADEAIDILTQRTDIQIVFTDVDMPGSMDGLKLATFIRNRWPPIKLILTSGRMPVRDADVPYGGLFFAKPYRAQEIASAFRELLDPQRS